MRSWQRCGAVGGGRPDKGVMDMTRYASVVATDGTVTDGPYPETKEVLGGFAVVEVSSRDEAHEWAAKIAARSPLMLRVGLIPPLLGSAAVE